MLLNFGASHTINGLSRPQNLALFLYTNLLLLPTLLKIIQNELVFNAKLLMLLLGICIYVYVCVCVCVCVYIYIYIYMHTKIIETELGLYNEREREGK
jgi:hypothetical protein